MVQKIYSYMRWSSAIQSEGTTKARQAAAAVAYARQNDLELVELVDDGISAFKSLNTRSESALGKFLEAIDQALIPSNAYLFVESLDRITRDEIDIALELFMGILRRGVTIVTGMDNKVYTHAGIKDNPIDLLTSILLFTRAHEESKTKQKRTNGNALALIERFNSGLPTTIKSVGSHPWWIDASTPYDKAVRMHPVFWNAAQFAMNHFLEGISAFRVTRLLNENFPKLYKEKDWIIANVRKLRINPAVYGLRVINVDGRNYELRGYFPALITEGQFYRLQQIRETTKYLGQVGDGEKNNINLLAGMRIFRCGHCGSTMMAMRHHDTIRYLCEKGRGNNHDCKTWSMPGILVEHTLMLVTTIAYIDIQRNGIGDKDDYTQQIQNIEKLIEDIGVRISRGTELILSGLGSIDEVKDGLVKLDKERKNLNLELDVLQRKQLLAQDNTSEELMMNFFNYAQYGVLQDPVHEYRTKLRDIVRSSIVNVKAWKFDRRLYISFQIKGFDEYFNFGAGATPYDWGCYFGDLPFTDTSSGDIEVPEDKLQEAVQRYAAYQKASMDMLDQAIELLRVVHYPDLDSRLFWPRK